MIYQPLVCNEAVSCTAVGIPRGRTGCQRFEGKADPGWGRMVRHDGQGVHDSGARPPGGATAQAPPTKPTVPCHSQ